MTELKKYIEYFCSREIRTLSILSYLLVPTEQLSVYQPPESCRHELDRLTRPRRPPLRHSPGREVRGLQHGGGRPPVGRPLQREPRHAAGDDCQHDLRRRWPRRPRRPSKL